jgi:uncharacterized protein (TIGR02996 family)
MNRESLLGPILKSPEDDVARLVYARWLERHSDPLGEFIRLQIELEPLRHPREDPVEELERHHRLDGIPPGAAQRDPDWYLTRQLDREEELLRQHRSVWLGAAADLENDVYT